MATDPMPVHRPLLRIIQCTCGEKVHAEDYDEHVRTREKPLTPEEEAEMRAAWSGYHGDVPSLLATLDAERAARPDGLREGHRRSGALPDSGGRGRGLREGFVESIGLSCCPHTEPAAISEHQDDSYGSCVVCREYVAHTDDDHRLVAWPCPTVRLRAALAAPAPAPDAEP